MGDAFRIRCCASGLALGVGAHSGFRGSALKPNSNRDTFLLEKPVNPRKQTVEPISNRDKSAVLIGGTALLPGRSVVPIPVISLRNFDDFERKDRKRTIAKCFG